MLESSNAADALDVVGVNYFLKDYDATHKRLPHKVMLGTENCPTYATRGVHISDKNQQIFAQYGDEWGNFSESLDETMETIFSKPFVAGCFAWCGFDHRGEPTPYGWPSVISHWGFHDECGFAKETAYLLKAWYSEELCVKLLPHWNWEDGETVRVCAFTNADRAELFLNGKSLGVQPVVLKKAFWNVPFAEGELKVVAGRDNHTISDSVYTAKKPARLVLENWTEDISNSDVRVINVSVTDENGVLVPDFNETVTFSVSDGVILGVGNGDPNSHHHQKSESISLFYGKAQIIVRAGATVTATCKELTAVI
jgi:beta-galactosidase